MSLVEKIIYKGETSGAAFTMRHDILAEYHDKVFVLDTKYKEMSRFEDNPDYKETISNEAKQGDLYQVLEYARKRDIQDVHFIRMPFIFEEDEDRTRQQLTDVIKVVFSIQKDHYYE